MENSQDHDLDITRAIIAGSTEAWQRFVLRYSGLILSTLRRHFYDEDDVRDAYVEVLTGLRDGKLASFAGRSALSTWLVIVTRNVASDFLRRKFGRRKLPRRVRRLSGVAQEVFRLYYIQGLDFESVRHWATRGGRPLGAGELVSILRSIEAELGDRILHRMAHDPVASSWGGPADPRLLEACRSELEERQLSLNPEYQQLLREAGKMAEEVARAVRELTKEEQRTLEMRFARGRTAKEISDELGLGGEQRAFTMIRIGLRKLRRLLEKRVGEGAEFVD